MNTKHTPGPWTIDGLHISGNGYSIAHINSHRTTEGRANADLIAAAPELLEALENLLDAVRQNIDGKPPTADQIFEIGGHAAVAAIAKATGAA